MKSRVTIDARWLEGGIGTYTKHLLECLWRYEADLDVYAITREEHREVVRPYCTRMQLLNSPIYSIREQLQIPLAARGCQLLHVPHYNAPVFHRGPLVISIHDVIHITDPDYRRGWRSWAYAWPILTIMAKKAQHIITVSEYSKSQIVERLGVPATKVAVIYHGVSKDFRPRDRKEALKSVTEALGIPEPYLLYIGWLKPHKNLCTLLRAFNLSRERRDIPHRLLILGEGAPGHRELLAECGRLGITGKVDIIPRVPQQLLLSIYSAADALVMPSRNEGFGLPVLEAMACGTPVVCSRAAALPEVGGDAVEYFDPQSPEDLADALERVLTSPARQEVLRAKGLERAARFTWKEAVEKHVRVYRSAMG